MLPPVCKGGNTCNQPEQCARQIYPYGVLHALNVSVAMGIFVYIQLVRVDRSASDLMVADHEYSKSTVTATFRAQDGLLLRCVSVFHSPLPFIPSSPGCVVQRELDRKTTYLAKDTK